ncbi:MAG TPA: alpha/beta hydrolase, partial [Actinopolymorphaceae bacterium]
PPERVLLVGKSMGTFAAPVAAERELPAIWLTPLLTERTVADAIARTTAPRLLVGGTDDPSWESETAKRSGADVLEIPGAHHGLEIAGDPIRSVEVLGRITEAMDRFVEAADTGR